MSERVDLDSYRASVARCCGSREPTPYPFCESFGCSSITELVDYAANLERELAEAREALRQHEQGYRGEPREDWGGNSRRLHWIRKGQALCGERLFNPEVTARRSGHTCRRCVARLDVEQRLAAALARGGGADGG